MLLALQATAEGAGQLEKVASTFGVDWPHLGAQIVSFGIVCGILYLLAYKPILQMLGRGASRSRAVSPTPRRSRRSWPGLKCLAWKCWRRLTLWESS